MPSTQLLPFPALLQKLCVTPAEFTPFDAHHAFLHLCSADPPADVHISAFLTALKVSGLDQKAPIIAVAAAVLRDHAIRVDFDRKNQIVCDIVGTGGDGHNAFNVSTTAAIVAAGAGCQVCKHGNKAASSSSGSADILMSMGVPLPQLQSTHITTLLAPPYSNPFVFLFAANFHPTSLRLAPLRKSLGFPTIFNILGPLLNPSRPSVMIIGVNNHHLGPVFIEALKVLEVKRAWVVHGSDGLDELTPAGPSSVWELEDGVIKEEKIIRPSDLGIKEFAIAEVSGGGPDENATLLKDLLDGKLGQDHPIENFVVLNAAPLIYLAGKASSLKDGVRVARESISSGQAKAAFEKYKDSAIKVVSSSP